jgi:mono/diheme cytochrome c family protein
MSNKFKRNKKVFFMRQLSLLVSLAFLAVAAASAQNKTLKAVPLQPTATLEGSDTYNQYCAVCHGKDGKGAGPAADALKKQPTDLTQLARRNNGKFDDLAVQSAIIGDTAKVVAHGSLDMLVWGELFKSVSGDASARRLRVHSLVKYIEQMQAK